MVALRKGCSYDLRRNVVCGYNRPCSRVFNLSETIKAATSRKRRVFRAKSIIHFSNYSRDLTLFHPPPRQFFLFICILVLPSPPTPRLSRTSRGPTRDLVPHRNCPLRTLVAGTLYLPKDQT